ncbi:hypothetical protein K7G98_41335, partial [Saccharothrix sp. MB29]|nr:hypothetical protein [Saccharothrix sp. MB29]
ARAVGRVDHLVVADIDWPRFARTFTSARPSPLLSDLVEVPAERLPAPSWPDRLDRLPAAARDEALLALVLAEVAATLGHATPDDV